MPSTRHVRRGLLALASTSTLLLIVMPAWTAAANSLSPDTIARIEALITASGADVAVATRSVDGAIDWRRAASERFHAASTMKVPVMIELFRQAELGTRSLDDRIPVTNTFASIVDGSPYSLSVDDDSDADIYAQVGEAMTLRELCERMITSSSNLATNLLIATLGVDNVRRTVDALGASGMDVKRGVEDNVAFRAGLNNTTDATGLLVLFDALATGRAVSTTASAAMIDVLARQHFNDAIPAGVPPGTRVAHKTGSITRIQHDAGIVYGPRPYTLVVLVRGLDDETRAKKLIADVTREIDAEMRGSASPAPPR